MEFKKPGNMGICGACFLRDVGGSLGAFAKGPAVFRPEVPGLILGALAAIVADPWIRRRSAAAA